MQLQPRTFTEGTPLAYCIEKFGGVLAFCRAINRSTSQIYRWRNNGGLLSAAGQTDVLIAARKLGVDIDPSKLVYIPPMVERQPELAHTE